MGRYSCIRFLLASIALLWSAKVVYAQQGEGHHAVPGFRWPGTLVEMQAADRTPVSVVEPFLNELRPAGVPTLQLGQFLFAPLATPQICLAATVDASGRQMYFALAVVCPGAEAGSFRMTILPSAPPHLLGTELVDLSGDGVSEIVTRELSGEYQGSQTLPLYWYSVFRVKNSVPVDVSANYKAFYSNRLLPELDFVSHLVGSAYTGVSSMTTEARAEADFLKAKYERRIGGQPRAGFQAAVEWAKSPIPHVQMLAVETFRDMSGPDASAELKKLEESKDYVVAQAATNALTAK